MALFREKHPEVIVDLEIWDPATDLPESPVAPEKDAEGNAFGRIHTTDGRELKLLPGWAYWHVVSIGGSPVTGAPQYEICKPDHVAYGFEPVAEEDPHKKLPKGEKHKKGFFE